MRADRVVTGSEACSGKDERGSHFSRRVVIGFVEMPSYSRVEYVKIEQLRVVYGMYDGCGDILAFWVSRMRQKH